MILTPLQKLPKNVEDLGKLIVAKGLKNVPKVKKIAQSGHTTCHRCIARSIARDRTQAEKLMPQTAE